MTLLALGSLLIFYLFLNKMLVRKLLKRGPLGNTTLLAFTFVAGLAIGSGNLQVWVWLPLLLAFAVYHWPRLKAFFQAIGNG
jgi:hypothetical protein